MTELHFRKGHARTLRNIGEGLRRTFPTTSTAKASAASLFERAAQAAKAGQPLKVEDDAAARVMAESIVSFGGPMPRVVTVGG